MSKVSSEVAVDKVSEVTEKDGNHITAEIKGTKRPADVSNHVYFYHPVT